MYITPTEFLCYSNGRVLTLLSPYFNYFKGVKEVCACPVSRIILGHPGAPQELHDALKFKSKVVLRNSIK